MALEDVKQEYEALVKQVKYHNHLYYDKDAPELSDYEYDALTRRLKQLEQQFPELISEDSPTQKVGGAVSTKFDKVQHAVRMESLQDVFDMDEVRDFDRRVREAGLQPSYVVECKIDGLSVSLEYQDGIFVRGSTRGDGDVGEDRRRDRAVPLRCTPYLLAHRIPAHLTVQPPPADWA